MPANVLGVNLGTPADKAWSGGDGVIMAHRVLEMETDLLRALWLTALGRFEALVLPGTAGGASDQCLVDAALQEEEPEMALYVTCITRTVLELLRSPPCYWVAAVAKALDVVYAKALEDEGRDPAGGRAGGLVSEQIPWMRQRLG